jgi:hypothetical protein
MNISTIFLVLKKPYHDEIYAFGYSNGIKCMIIYYIREDRHGKAQNGIY